MKSTKRQNCPGITRRSFLADTGMGFTGLALGAMLFRDGVARAEEAAWRRPDGQPHFAPKAKSVIWIFLCGGVSHLESFDVKPELNKYAGKSIGETPYKDVLNTEGKDVIGANPKHGNRKVIMPLQAGYKQYGESGLVVGDWFKNVGECADDLAVVRSLWTIHNDHGAQLTWQTGRHPRELEHPTIGSWITYGLGTRNENLPEYVVLGVPTGDCCGGAFTHGAAYLGPEHGGVRMNVDAKKPLAFIRPPEGVTPEEQAANLSLLGKLNHFAGIDYPDDQNLRARIKSYELAFQMQTSIPETLQLEKESEATRKLYGLDKPECKAFGEQCLAARRLVERGVRFVQLFHGGGGGGGDWDAHSEIKSNHTKLAAQVDQPIAGLLKDLKQRGMLQDTLVVFGTEFGRSPGAEGTGRDHHPQAFCAWLAGAGVKGGTIYGATDEIGFHSAVNRRYVTDIHATVLQLLGLNSRRLEVPGRKRLDMDHGEVIEEILA